MRKVSNYIWLLVFVVTMRVHGAEAPAELVRAEPVLPGPRVMVTSTAEPGVTFGVEARRGGAPVAVSATIAGGQAVAIESLGANRYRVPHKLNTVVTVKATVANGGEHTLRVYAGDFGAALRLLAADKPAGAALEKSESAQWLRLVAGNWREERLRELLDKAPKGDGAAGADVEDYLYLTEVTGALKAPDVMLGYRGKELPIRVELPARKGRQAARFDALLRLPGESAPEKTGAAPFLVRVHGFTPSPSLEGARLDVAKIGWDGEFPFVVLSPVCNKVMREENWDTAELAALVELVREKLPIDGAKVFLTGFSMGGYTTLKLANERPDLFTAWAAVCGWGDVFNLGGAAKRPGWLIHGDRDPVVLPYESVRVYRMLRAMGAPVRLTMYSGIDHNAWDPAYRQADFYRWLLEQRAEGGARPPVVPLEPAETLLVFEKPLTLREAFSGDAMGAKLRELFSLYPAVALTGDLTLHAPQGLGSEDARCFLGVPVKEDTVAPAGFSRVALSKSEGGPVVRRLELDVKALLDLASEGGEDATRPLLVRFGEWNSRKRQMHVMLMRQADPR